MTRLPGLIFSLWAAITFVLLASVVIDYAFTPSVSKPRRRNFWMVLLVCLLWPAALLSSNGRDAITKIFMGVQS